jgi:hypothetical protein
VGNQESHRFNLKKGWMGEPKQEPQQCSLEENSGWNHIMTQLEHCIKKLEFCSAD